MGLGSRRGWAKIRALAVPLIALAAVAASSGLAGGAAPTPIVPSTQRVAGKTYTEWMVASWQWALAHAHSEAGAPPRSFSCVRSGQRGKVWFLTDEYEGDAPVTVSCEVPAARYLFLEGPAFECSTVEPAPFGAARVDLVRCARRIALRGVRLTLDGTTLKPSGYTIATPVFRFVMPANNNVLRVPGQTRGFSAVRGDAAMLAPLAAGTHTLVQREQFSGGSVVETTWKLKVR